jgi:CxxC motif-containing protein (DUF1111 family)
MCSWNFRVASSLSGTLIVGLFISSILAAQESEVKARKGFTGKQLFEHEWVSVDSPLRELEVPLVTDREMIVKRRGVLGDGLGPLHNATSCSLCHVDGGASGVKHNVTMITVDPRSVARNSKANGGQHLLDVFPGLLGPQGALAFSTVVHDRSTRPGYMEIRDRLATYVPGGIDDQWFQPKQRNIAAIARQPVVAGRHGTVDFYLSQRNPPPLWGLGEIDLITELRIGILAKRQSEKSNGRISGRFVGRFGWRGQVASLSAFVTQACAGELGLSQGVDMLEQRTMRRMLAQRIGDKAVDEQFPNSDGIPLLSVTQAGDPADLEYANFGADMTLAEVNALTRFVASIPRPIEKPQRGNTHEEVLQGERFFGSIGCSDCHVPDLRPVSGMFSDLLLHDMGPELQSPFPAPLGTMTTKLDMPAPRFDAEGPTVSTSQQYYGMGTSASLLPRPYPLDKPETPQFPRGKVPESDTWSWDALQREWRTAPLWGVADTAPYLHDGRAETLEEAIVWHGGEAESSRDGYSKLSRQDKDRVLAFLFSLRAPETVARQDK